jgi:hypothetical protein
MKKFYDIPSNTTSEVYSVILIIENGEVTDRSSCTCKKGSFYRWRKKIIAEGKWKCSHIKEAERRYNEKH